MYAFLPSPDIAFAETNYVYWENGFSDDDIKEVIRIGESLELSDATVGSDTPQGIVDEKIRTSKVSWIHYNQTSDFLFNKLGYIARSLNGQFFGFDLYGFGEPMQYTVYHSEGNNHYDWHMDKGMKNHSPRKLSMVLQLSDPNEYEGGELEIFVSNETIKLEKRKGLVWAFPSYIMHRVTPVTKGIRKSLVVWITGPKFR